MDNQQLIDELDAGFWDSLTSGDAQFEFDSMVQDTNEFDPLDGSSTQPMDMADFSLDRTSATEYASILVDQFLTPEELAILPAQLDVLDTLPMDMTVSYQPEAAEQDFAEGDDFLGYINDDCFGADQFTSPMAANLDQIFIESNDQQLVFEDNSDQNTFGDLVIDPSLLNMEDYTYLDPQAANETFANQDYVFEDFDLDLLGGQLICPDAALVVPAVDQVAPQYPLEEPQNFQFDDLELFGEDQPVTPAPTKKIFLPTPPPAVARVPKAKKAHREIDVAPRAIKPEAGPSTPVRATRKPLADISPLKCAGQIKVVNQSMGPSGKSSYKYTVYKPLHPWGDIKYNSRGYLDRSINFNAKRMNEFINNHPLGDKLFLRIDKHPYEMKYRETGSLEYISCRAAKCILSGKNRFTAGDLRISIDEVSNRFGADDVKNNCPYFAAGYLHLECFENLVDPIPLAHAGIIAPDRRTTLIHEPDRAAKVGSSNNNKMALVKKQITGFERWVAAHPVGSKRAEGKDTLNATIWMCGQRPGRIRSHFPPGVRLADVKQWIKDNRHSNGWGGRRMARGTVEELAEKIAAGKQHEIIAPRNGPNGKPGMTIGGGRARKRRRHDTSTDASSNSDSESGSGSGSGSDSDSPAPRVRRHKRRRSDHHKKASSSHRIKLEPRRRYNPTPSPSSPHPRLTFTSKAVFPPKVSFPGSDDSVQEITAEEAMATRHPSTRIKKEVITYVISDDDDDSEKENRDPTYTKEKSGTKSAAIKRELRV